MRELIEGLRTERGIDWPRVVLVGLAVTVGIAILISAATSTAVFSPYNPSWEGTSEFRSMLDEQATGDHVVARNQGRYDELEADGAVVYVVAPDSADQTDALRQFVDRGATLVLLDNFGAGNAVLEQVGATARLDGRLLKDERNNVNGPAMPLATEVASQPLTVDVEQLSLNYATTVDPGEATVLVRSSPYGYLVESERQDVGEGSALADRPVATVESVGAGRVITVGDPSITINAMLDEPDNRQFLARTAAAADTIVVDQTLGEPVPPLVGTILFLRESSLAVASLGGLLVVGLVLLGRSRRSADGESKRRPVHPSDEAMADYLTKQHPDWDEEYVEEMITAFNRSRAKNGDR